MQIFTLTYDLLRWLLPHSERFPKAQRFVVTKRLQDTVLDFYETIYLANAHMGRTREGHLRTADAHLNKLRSYLRLVFEWGWLTSGQYAHVSKMVTQIGQRLGGLLKQTMGLKK